MRTPNNNVSYLLTDHLGSTSLTTNSTGEATSELRYTAWGETRYTSGTSPTNYRYTGQRQEVSFGLYFYNARWYDNYLTHFTQADTIIPAGVQGLDRYAYTDNNPVRYTDPSGHVVQGRCNYRKNYNCDAPTAASPQNGISEDQIQNLLGFTWAEFNDWLSNENNADIYNMLFNANLGDIIRLKLGNAENNFHINLHYDDSSGWQWSWLL